MNNLKVYINSAVLYENYLKLTIDLKFDPNFSQGHNEALMDSSKRKRKRKMSKLRGNLKSQYCYRPKDFLKKA